jgi:hypothetical protein
MAELPTVVGPSGLQPQTPAQVKANLLAAVIAVQPGYTSELPGIMVEDILSTDTAAVLQCDSARVDSVNSLTPFGANPFLLNQLGQMLGIPIGGATNTSVFVLFTSNTPGFVIGKGFLVSDGNVQYSILDGGSIDSSGQALLFAIATQPGSFAVPPGTVNELDSSVPATVSLSCVNPEAGLPGDVPETEALYRARVQQANLAGSQGMARYLKTLLGKVPGVQKRLIAVQEQDGGGWKVLCGGGDPYLVAYAIYTALFDVSTLVGSVLKVSTISNALPAVVTTILNHLFSPGQTINIAGVTPSGFNGNFVVVNVLSEKTFSIGKSYLANNLTAQSWSGGVVTYTTTTSHGVTVGSTFSIVGSTPTGYNGTFVATSGTTGSTLKAAMVSDPGTSSVLGQLTAGVSLFDSTGLSAYVSGGVITPNLRNVSVSLLDYPDTYVIPYVNPPQQSVTMTVTWDTDSQNFVSPAAVAQVAAPAIVDYVNSVFAGQPMNVLGLEDAFQAAVQSILPTEFISTLTFAVAINGVGTSPAPGTTLIAGDPESYFFSLVTDISVVQA